MRNGLLVLTIPFLSLLAACAGSGGGGSQLPPPPADNGSTTPVRNTIAYVRGDTRDEIRLVAPDGSGDRPLWTHNQTDPNNVYEVWSLTWRPDARALAFASTHENWCSLNNADIFAVGADGTGYRRITEAPTCADLASYSKGTVQVPVENASFESFVGFIYFQGAPSVQQVSLPPGGSSVVTFENVADFGTSSQIAALIAGPNREIYVGTAVDVQAGGTVTTGPMSITPPTVFWEAFAPTWHSDGSRLGYVFNFNSLLQLPASPQPLEFGSLLLAEGAAVPNVILRLAWGPTLQTANRLLHQGGVFGASTGIYLTTEGSATTEELLSFAATESVFGLAWLPDGSGFVYSVTEGDSFSTPRSANLFVYTLATRQATRITNFSGEFAGMLSVSPNAQQVVFERASALDDLGIELTNPDLWVVGRDGNGLRLLVANARAPGWSP